MVKLLQAGEAFWRGSGLRHRVFRAGSWTLFGHFSTLMLRFASTLVLTRVFTPDIFGIVAIAASIQLVVALVTDFGLSQAVIQSPNGEDQTFQNTAWSLQVIRGFLITGVGALAALLVFAGVHYQWFSPLSVYSNPAVPAVIVATSASAIIMGFRSIKAIVINRNLELRRVTLIELTSQLVNFLVVVLLGWKTGSVWSFVVGGIASSAVNVILTHTWLPGFGDRFGWDSDALAELKKFGKWVVLSSSVGSLATSGDRLLLATWIGPNLLGYYSLASNIATIADGITSRVFGGVSMPAFSEIVRDRPQRLAPLYMRMRLISDPVMVFGAGFLFASGDWIIGILYDQRYSAAGPMLQISLIRSFVFAIRHYTERLSGSRATKFHNDHQYNQIGLFAFIDTGFLLWFWS